MKEGDVARELPVLLRALGAADWPAVERIGRVGGTWRDNLLLERRSPLL